jgi:transcriptional regulator EpsA
MSAVLEQPIAEYAPLTLAERETFVALAESALRIASPADFLAWSTGPLQTLFPHGMLICGLGQIGGPSGQSDSIRIHRMLSWNFPREYVEAIRRDNAGVMSPIMRQWCREFRPQLFEPGRAPVDPGWLAIFERFGLVNIAAHGMRDVSSNMASYFNFSRVPGPLGPRTATLLELLVPHMHVALLRACAGEAEALGKTVLSAREREVLRWLREGKTNWEIAQILGTSANTVKHQVRSLLVKLRVRNRAQAVAEASGLNVL